MKTFAEFQIIGRVGNVTPAGPTLKVSIAADYGRRNDKDGETRYRVTLAADQFDRLAAKERT